MATTYELTFEGTAEVVRGVSNRFLDLAREIAREGRKAEIPPLISDAIQICTGEKP